MLISKENSRRYRRRIKEKTKRGGGKFIKKKLEKIKKIKKLKKKKRDQSYKPCGTGVANPHLFVGPLPLAS